MMDFIENIDVDITKYLQTKRDDAIKNILNILDVSDIQPAHRKKVRKVVLEEVNEFYDTSIRVLTYTQEKMNGV